MKTQPPSVHPRVDGLYAPGSLVSIGPEDARIEGVIKSIKIFTGQVIYEVVWWDGQSRESEYFDQFEVHSCEKSSPNFSIGFVV